MLAHMEPANPATDSPTPKGGKKSFGWYLLLAVLLLAGAGIWLQKTASRPLEVTAQTPVATSTTQVTTSTDIGVSRITEISASDQNVKGGSVYSFAAFVKSLVMHVAVPDEVRGLYLTAYTAGSTRADELLAYSTARHLNTWVIDVKLDNGELAFAPNDEDLQKYAAADLAIKDLDGLLARLKDKNIYRIARIFVMRDGAYGKIHPSVSLRDVKGGIWHDKTGTPWLDPAAPEVADYAVAVAQEAYARGFDEIQFDYIRYPTDGNVSSIVYPVYDEKTPKAVIMKRFFDRVGDALKKDDIPVSYDLYGMTFWRTDDFGIGQRLASVYPTAIAVSPMVYPSHYPEGFQGFANPAEHPYEIVKLSLDKGIEILKIDYPQVDEQQARKKFRPWIQDFDIGATYDAPKIEAQIKAARDAGAGGWLLWNARNVYEPAKYTH